jgi:predicted amidophosphoribosyltransferase
MGLMTCPTCSKSVSESASSCPHCGENSPRDKAQQIKSDNAYAKHQSLMKEHGECSTCHGQGKVHDGYEMAFGKAPGLHPDAEPRSYQTSKPWKKCPSCGGKGHNG